MSGYHFSVWGISLKKNRTKSVLQYLSRQLRTTHLFRCTKRNMIFTTNAWLGNRKSRKDEKKKKRKSRTEIHFLESWNKCNETHPNLISKDIFTLINKDLICKNRGGTEESPKVSIGTDTSNFIFCVTVESAKKWTLIIDSVMVFQFLYFYGHF